MIKERCFLRGTEKEGKKGLKSGYVHQIPKWQPHIYICGCVSAGSWWESHDPLRILFSFVLSVVRASPVAKMKRWRTESEKCSGALLLSEPGRVPSSDFTHGEVGKGIHLPRSERV